MFIQLGEVRDIAIDIFSKSNRPFTIDSATYSIENEKGEELSNGVISIDEHRLIASFNATKKGIFYMVFIYNINNEKLKAKVKVEVI